MRKVCAFTLMELIVAMSVTSVLVVLMLQVFSDSTTAWQRNDEKLDTFREARAAVQMISRDLSQIIPTQSTPDKFPILALDHHENTKDEDKVNQEFYALSAVRNKGRGDLCAVGYYCFWDKDKTAFTLRRQITESTTTFSKLQKALLASGPMSGKAAFDLIYERKPDETDVQTFDDMACYVWDLKVELPPVPPSTVAPVWPQGYFSKDLPPWIEIRFKALGANATRKLKDHMIKREDWFDDKSTMHQRFILPGEQQFVTRVKLCR